VEWLETSLGVKVTLEGQELTLQDAVSTTVLRFAPDGKA
jgi:hypothetical protein